MIISKINEGYVFGNEENRNKVVIYISFSCIDCLVLYNNLKDIFNDQIMKSNLVLIIKPVYKPKFEIDDFINKNIFIESLDDIGFIFSKFELYSKKDKNLFETIFKEKISKSGNNYKLFESQIIKEVKTLNIIAVPTIFINEKRYDDTVFTEKEFLKQIKNK
ncbi:MAG: thioredoxin domain-containing protein [Oscillospiraceae bacterium]|nr:thioredoxin domain-containing protein [Oscillospiraceae bacterium]